MREVRPVPIHAIIPDPGQPRKEFDEEGIEELARSIKRNGLLQPITVRDNGQGQFIIIAGERRYRAMLVNDAEEVECIIYTGTSSKELQLIENINRVDLNPMEVARAYQKYIDEGHTVEDLCDVTGKAKGQITWSLNLLRCREDIQHLVSKGQMTVSVAGYLSKLSMNGQAQAVRAMNSEILSVSECHKLTEIIYLQENQSELFTPEEIPVLDEKTVETRHKVDNAFERACAAFEEIAELEASNPGITGQAVADKLDIVKEKADKLYKLIGEFKQTLEYKRVSVLLGGES